MGRTVELGEARILHPGPLRWLRALAWLLVCGFVVTLAFAIGYAATLFVASPFVDGIQLHKMASPPPVRLAANIVGAALVLLVYPLLVQLGEGRSASELAWRKALPELGIGLAIGAAMMLAA